jgi:ubiquinone/menaquinone biosynthesis C-methylase UbiE
VAGGKNVQQEVDASTQQSADYVLGGSETELIRLRAQAEEYEEQARWLVDMVGIRHGWRVLDVGCGPIGILRLLSEKVGPSGEVVGVEREHPFVELARFEIERLGLQNVKVFEADALNCGLESESFDLVHERLVLVNVPERQALLSEMLRLTAPGGFVALEDIDNVSWLCQPAHPSWDALQSAFHQAFRAGGGDPFVGRRLPALLRDAGASDVQARLWAELPQPGQYRRTHLISLVDSIRKKVLDMNLMSESDLDAHRQALLQHLTDPNTVVIEKLLMQCWARSRRNRER